MKRISFLLTLIFLCFLAFPAEKGDGQTSGFNDDFNDNARDTNKWVIGTLHDTRFNSQKSKSQNKPSNFALPLPPE